LPKYQPHSPHSYALLRSGTCSFPKCYSGSEDAAAFYNDTASTWATPILRCQFPRSSRPPASINALQIPAASHPFRHLLVARAGDSFSPEHNSEYSPSANPYRLVNQVLRAWRPSHAFTAATVYVQFHLLNPTRRPFDRSGFITLILHTECSTVATSHQQSPRTHRQAP
jgi:hypothetical protein